MVVLGQLNGFGGYIYAQEPKSKVVAPREELVLEEEGYAARTSAEIEYAQVGRKVLCLVE